MNNEIGSVERARSICQRAFGIDLRAERCVQLDDTRAVPLQPVRELAAQGEPLRGDDRVPPRHQRCSRRVGEPNDHALAPVSSASWIQGAEAASRSIIDRSNYVNIVRKYKPFLGIVQASPAGPFACSFKSVIVSRFASEGA
jgi:hypothetical protein